MSTRECAIVMAYTGFAMFKGEDLKYFYDYVCEILGIPFIYTHEIAMRMDEIREKAKPDFIDLCRNRKD